MNPVSVRDEVLREPSRSAPDAGSRLEWKECRERFRGDLQQSLPAGLGKDEVEAHFEAMPAHYWERVNQEDLVWGLETIHGFLKFVATPNVPATMPFVNSRQIEQRGQTRIMLCTWDR